MYFEPTRIVQNPPFPKIPDSVLEEQIGKQVDEVYEYLNEGYPHFKFLTVCGGTTCDYVENQYRIWYDDETNKVMRIQYG